MAKKATISLIRMTQKIDAGKILKERDILINKFTDINDLHKQANKLFPKLVNSVIDKIETIKGRVQNEKKAIYWHQRNDEDGYINFSKFDAPHVSRLVRALTTPYPGAWANLKNHKIRIFKIEIPKFDLRGTPGKVLYIQKQGPFVVCKDRAVLIKDYKIESKKNIKLKHGQFLN
jgi:methionyl-tRNA formyltransferase